MHRTTWLALGSLALFACGGGAVPPSPDAGPIAFVDSGEAPDSPDAYVAPDAGDGTCGMVVSSAGWPQLPDTCGPRCSSATQQAAAACPTGASQANCIYAALEADTTPAATVNWGGRLFQVDCGGSSTVYGCFEWQSYSIWVELCPTEWNTYTDCASDGSACDPQYNAVDACARANPMWATLIQERGAVCYPH